MDTKISLCDYVRNTYQIAKCGVDWKVCFHLRAWWHDYGCIFNHAMLQFFFKCDDNQLEASYSLLELSLCINLFNWLHFRFFGSTYSK